jgi:C-terminal processing protease CtpA/Prc
VKTAYRWTSVTLACGLLLAACAPASPQIAGSTTREVENVRTFARLYGYVRFFHPSDEAAAVDWDRFAILGVREVLDAPDPEALRLRLEGLFGPIAPGLGLGRAGAALAGVPAPANSELLEWVTWQHRGVLLDPSRMNTYWSIRTHRTAEMASAPSPAIVGQRVDAVPLRGREVRLRARVRVLATGITNRAQLWVRVDREGGARGFFDNMADRPITVPEWSAHEITGNVDDDAQSLNFGAIAQGLGSFAFDAFELSVRQEDGTWAPVEIADPGFESELPEETASPAIRPQTTDRWVANAAGFRMEVGSSDPFEGSRALEIHGIPTVMSEPLFDKAPSPGEVLQLPIGSGLEVALPVSVPSDDRGTLPRADSAALIALHHRLAQVDAAQADPTDAVVRLAAVAILWNVMQHFYPYFDLVTVDWEAALPTSLTAARDGKALEEVLNSMLERLEDGHGSLLSASGTVPSRIPWALEWIEDRAVVVASGDTSIERGDVILAVDGERVEDLLTQQERQISGSPQWKRFRALGILGAADSAAPAHVLIGRAGRELEVAVTRGARRTPPQFEREPITVLQPGIWYVDLTRAPAQQVFEHVDSLAAADGVIFDMRGYPVGANHYVLQHLLETPDTSTAWMRTPHTIYPDRDRPVGFREAGWELQPAEPRIRSNVAFITDGRAISYSESLLSFVEHYRLGEIVGAPTAGANGNVNPLTLPGGFVVFWTGMRVVKHDGSRHHGVGVLPSIPASRTIEGVRAGRDELLDAALRAVRDRTSRASPQ